MITEETIARMKQNLEVKNEYVVLDAIKHLEEQIKELKKDKEYLDKVNNEQTRVILKLNEQIEKMKCCQNCKYYTCLDDEEHLYGCKKPNDCECFEKWELAE